mmetsp:Transcript_7432/g.18799  ORF Transcript_7432/g.18799 Transcript_7432/m.18799 type:complete len:508 (-) Transcript_7432:21-1544(-)|eukprot:CAMPEP_0183395062 /NCGR_PEP_ID=MMETSP0370-20130417/9034_1 /TAXON_ID=268820 /ORGANISM="Peridinium aciculiferum, Strain PAER-2" /LENGTH=507 /DNA_ID=CAMNT_0025575591 /DNA_START=84 /DNA_END=1607 /DNA_ORIENTATION=-
MTPPPQPQAQESQPCEPQGAKAIPAQVDAPGIFKGAPVTVRALQGAPEYNGCKGVVTAGPFENGRYEVTMEAQGKPETKVLSLKPANFVLDTDALKEYVSTKRAEKARRSPPLEDFALVWAKGKGLSSKALVSKITQVPDLAEHHVLLRVEKFAFSQMGLGYLMKGFTRTFNAFHNFYQYGEEGFYRSACWGYATVMESSHPKVAVGTRLYGLVPPCRYHLMPVGGTIPRGRNGEPAMVELTMTDMPFNLRRFQEMEVVSAPGEHDVAAEVDGEASLLEDWRLVLKEIYTMAFYMDENLLVDTGMINSVIISCASAKTSMALAYCLRMREMRYVVGLTSKEHLEFVKATDLYHEVYTYDQVESLPNNRTIVYMDFKCDGELRQNITLRMGTNLMYNMVLGPAVFQKRMKDQVFEKRAREVLFDESSWRERRRMVAEVTKTGRNEKLKDSFPAFVQRLRQHVKLRRVCGEKAFKDMYDAVYSNTSSPGDAYICTLHEEEGGVDEIWGP